MKQRFILAFLFLLSRSFACIYPAEKRVRVATCSLYYFSVCTGLPTLTPCCALPSWVLVPLPMSALPDIWSQYSPSLQTARRALPCSVPPLSSPLATPSARLGCTAPGTFPRLALGSCRLPVSLCASRMTAHPPPRSGSLRLCLHISLLMVSLGFSVPFANAALLWRFVVRSGDCCSMVGTRSGCPLCPPVAPRGGFTLSHFRTAAHAAKPPPAPP